MIAFFSGEFGYSWTIFSSSRVSYSVRADKSTVAKAFIRFKSWSHFFLIMSSRTFSYVYGFSLGFVCFEKIYYYLISTQGFITVMSVSFRWGISKVTCLLLITSNIASSSSSNALPFWLRVTSLLICLLLISALAWLTKLDYSKAYPVTPTNPISNGILTFLF